MNKYLFLFLSLFCMIGCSDTPEEMNVVAEHNTLNVSVEQATITRNGFDEQGVFYWSDGDRLGVTTQENTMQFSALKLSEGAGTSYAKFKGGLAGTIGNYAVYPFSEDHFMTGTTLSYELPASYAYTQVDTDFFTPQKGQGQSFNAPMWGAISAGNVTMKHLGGVFCINIEELPVGENLKLVFASNHKLNGSFTADLSQPTPVINATNRTTEAEGQVEFTFSNAQAKTSGVFYVPAAVGIYENMRVKILNGVEELYNVAVGSFTIQRGNLKPVEVKNAEIDTDPSNKEIIIPDAAFRTYCLQNFDTNKDGKLVQKEADAVTKINVNKNYEIKSLEGIGNFRNLLRLDCCGDYYHRMQLSILDLSGCGQLTGLYCYYNRLTSLNLSGCSQLTVLDCDNNQLPSLDLSGCSQLTKLWCSGNQLLSLDLSGCSQLTKLWCSGNQLLSLDLSGCSQLTELDCEYNQLTSLDLLGCNQLTNLDCSDNHLLTSMNLSGFSKLLSINCSHCSKLTSLDLSGCSQLSELNCSYSGLTILDLSGCSLLKTFTYSGNPLETLNLSKCTQFTELNLTQTKSLISLNLSGCSLLESLDCRDNQLISLELTGCSQLMKLDCGLNRLINLDLSDCGKLANLICDLNTELTSLKLSGRWQLLTVNCTQCSKLMSLNLSGCGQLTELYCGYCQLTSLDLSGCWSLTKLYCFGNQIPSLDMSNCNRLRWLNCSSNPNLQYIYVWSGFDVSKLSTCTKDDHSQFVIKQYNN